MAVLGAFTGVLAIGLIVATLLPASSATTLRVHERGRQGFDKMINLDGKHSLAGDIDVQAHSLYNKANHVVGHDVVQLTFIRALGHRNARFRAAATFSIGNKGKLEVAGTSKFSTLLKPPGGTFAIVGGTGAYTGASGTLRVRAFRHRTMFTFRITP